MLTASEGWSTSIMAECVAIGRQAWHIAVAVGRVYIYPDPQATGRGGKRACETSKPTSSDVRPDLLILSKQSNRESQLNI